jgi:hypothetical protein
MSRLRPRVIFPEDSNRTLDTGAAPGGDTYVAQLIKYIPAETIAAHQAIAGIISKQTKDVQAQYLLVTALIALIFTFLWTLLGAKDDKEPLAWTQATVATLAFVAWLAAINSPAVHLVFPNWDEFKGSIVLTLATILIFPLLGRLLHRIIGK